MSSKSRSDLSFARAGACALFVATLGAAACSSSSDAPAPQTVADAGPQPPGPLVDAATVPTGLCATPPTGRVHLPADDSAHPKEQVEWWYWTGHLQAADGRWFGFEEVFFRGQALSIPGHMVHSAVTDISGDRFYHFSNTGPGDLASTPDGFAFEVAGQTAKGSDGHDTLHAQGDGYALNLKVSSGAKRTVLQHGDGYTDYSFGGYTYYYSRERMSAEGTLTLHGEEIPVTGTAWFDHQYGALGSAVTNGWDWFAFQLADGRDIMLFVVRSQGKQVLVGASMTDADCVTTEIPVGDVAVSSIGTWKSPHTHCTYPAGWNVRVGSESFVVTPFVADQEVYSSTPIYWEGASSLSKDGASVGRAYVELSGYCPVPLPL